VSSQASDHDSAIERMSPARGGAPGQLRPRRPYTAPRIVHREPLEAIAAVCSPAPPAKNNPGFCPMGPISS
jgi:hypothetical protein